MPTGNEKLYKDLGEVRGMLMGLDKRLTVWTDVLNAWSKNKTTF